MLRALPNVPISNVDLVAFVGSVNAGDAGIRVGGNINIVAVQVINAGNIQVGGTATGVPVVQAPPIGALTTASNTTGANQAVAPTTTESTDSKPSIIIVEFLGFGGDRGEPDQKPPQQQQNDDRKRFGQHGYDMSSPYQFLGLGQITVRQTQSLVDETRKRFDTP